MGSRDYYLRHRSGKNKTVESEMQTPPLALEDALFVGRPSTSRLQLHPRKRSRRSNSRPATAGIPRASSVPLLTGDHVPLEVLSIPVSLATRSLVTHPMPTAISSSVSVVSGQQKREEQRTKKRLKTGGCSGASSSVGVSRRGRMAAQFSGTTGRGEVRPGLVPSAESQSNTVSGSEPIPATVRDSETDTATVCDSYHAVCDSETTAATVCERVEEGSGETRVDSPAEPSALRSKENGVDPVVEGSLEETMEGEKMEAATRRVQRWFRSCRREQERERLAQVRSLLREKKTELDQSLNEQLGLTLREEKERDERRKKRRQEKMAASRQAAILSLQQKREEKRLQAEKIAQQEIALLQESGKIKRREKERAKKNRKKEAVQEKVERKATPPPPAKQTPPTNNSQELSEPRVALSPVHSTPPAVSKPASTYDDILDTLRLLEEAPPPLIGSKTPPTDTRENPSITTHTSAGVEVGVAKPSGPAHSSLSESKLQNILSYLDEMEREENRTHTATSGIDTTTADGGREGSVGVGKELEAAASDVTSTILSQRLEIDNKNKTVDMLQKALNQQRELTVYHAKEMEKEGERRLELQRQEYETTIQRHQTFIDQLIEDKKKLGERCEKLVKELRESSTKYQTKVKTMEETHAAELAKVKQVAAAADKLRREKWRADESRRIKEATVRSLEPEIQRIIHKGKADIQRLKSKHEAELLEADERAGRRFVAQMEELRAQCAMEKEAACAHERELARERYERLAEQEEMNAQQQRRRLFAELEQERDKMAAHWNLQRSQLEQQQTEALEAHTREVEELKRGHTEAMEEAERRHGSQLRSLEEKMATERQAWQENFSRRQETTFLAREREMRESLRQERDKEIEMVISRLEAEAEAAQTHNEKAADAKIKRIREKCEVELSEVERSERATQEKLTEAKRGLGEREGEVARLRSLLRQKEEEVRQVGEVAERLTRERDNVTDVVRQEFADRLVSTEEENRRIKLEMSELVARNRVELERAKREKERELEEVHSRVRQALEKKEGHLSTLRTQHTAALRRAEHLEMLLERQRKELLKK